MPLTTSLTALDIETGEVLWSRQLVHHDLWDFDTDAPPTPIDIEKGGETIPALVETSKMGFIYVLNRVTGEPVYPIEGRPVPASDVAGEEAAPTQPYSMIPKPVIEDRWPGVFRLADWAGFGYCSDTAAKLRDEGRFTPPSLQGTLTYPPTSGGIEWGGGAVDPNSRTCVVNNSSVVQIYQLFEREAYEQQTAGGNDGTYYPQTGSPYGFRLTSFLNQIGMPCWKPPYGSMSACDLDTGELLWKKPFGQVQQWGSYMPEAWGSPTIGGPVVTASGLIFIGASMDAHVCAIDLKSSEVLWKGLVDAPAVALPAVYTYKGKQYVVVTAGGNSILSPRVGDQIAAFGLPEEG